MTFFNVRKRPKSDLDKLNDEIADAVSDLLCKNGKLTLPSTFNLAVRPRTDGNIGVVLYPVESKDS